MYRYTFNESINVMKIINTIYIKYALEVLAIVAIFSGWLATLFT